MCSTSIEEAGAAVALLGSVGSDGQNCSLIISEVEPIDFRIGLSSVGSNQERGISLPHKNGAVYGLV